jgi:ATP-dependent DNA helicase DinG
MARAVEGVFHEGGHLAVQAGTGLGKTFAYLIPAVRFALREKKKVVVSTRTINLQQQIFNKDIPFLQQTLGKEYPFTAVLAKGRGNYLCLSKMQYLRTLDRGLFTSREEVQELAELQRLVSGRMLNTGDREELPFRVSTEVWSQINAEGESCLRRACGYTDACYYYAARRAQAKADILVVNHALFFADLAIRKGSDFSVDNSVLEDYDAVIFDEAHNLEDVATDFFSRAINLGRVRKVGAFILNSFREGGLLHDPGRPEVLSSLDALIQKANSSASDLFSQFSVTERMTSKRDKEAEILEGDLEALVDNLAGLTGTAPSEEANALLSLLHGGVEGILGDLRFIAQQLGEDAYAYWVEHAQTAASFKAAPISMEDDLRDNLFRRVSIVVLASATLSSVLLRRIGLEKCRLLRLESPFDYANNALLYLPPDSKDPRSPDFDEYTARKLLEIVEITEGRALVLFTSYRSMNTVYDRLTEVNGGRYTLLKQGSLPQSELMRSFREGIRSVLFAVASYWEGVDIPGEALSCVVLVKLPFAVPTEPIVQARLEQIELGGNDSFHSYSLPQAVLRLKQGFGRLIRSAQDKGVVVVLDRRISTRQYGRAFLKELPPARITDSLDDVRALFGVKRF